MGLARRMMRLGKRKETAVAKRRLRRALLEPLEPRLLLSADLSYTMTGTSDDLTLRLEDVEGTDTLKLIDNDDLSILASQALDETSAVEILGSDQSDILTIDFGFDGLLDLLPISFTDDSAGDSDWLEILGPDATWNITGADTGSVDNVDFFGIENLTGGPDNQDTFVFEEGGSLSGVVEGGAGGFDSLVIQGGTYDTVIFTPTGPDAGTADLDGDVITYAGLEPITMSGTSSVTVNGSPLGDTLLVDLDGSNVRVQADGTMESLSFGVPTASLTINGGLGDDSVTIEESLNMPGADLTINAETITVNSGVTITANDISLISDATDDGNALDLLDPLLDPIDYLNLTDNASVDEFLFADIDAIVDVSGATLIGSNITLSATSSLDLSTTGFVISGVGIAAIYAGSNAEVDR
ncbi:MAG: LEPR-XLL domain-containing protein, partial [Desulfobacterales bacterium]|nr:LEPR-XLL domain-containing protein [Desulfobacterales bacterium]